jgi:hypothetical protein
LRNEIIKDNQLGTWQKKKVRSLQQQSTILKRSEQIKERLILAKLIWYERELELAMSRLEEPGAGYHPNTC